MLYRHIHVLDHLGLGSHYLQQLIGDPLGIAVENTHPVHAIHLADLPDQLGKHQLAVDVLTVPGGILSHQVHLGDALGGKTPYLFQDILHLPAAEPSRILGMAQ